MRFNSQYEELFVGEYEGEDQISVVEAERDAMFPSIESS